MNTRPDVLRTAKNMFGSEKHENGIVKHNGIVKNGIVKHENRIVKHENGSAKI
jgi:hypothetical protein